MASSKDYLIFVLDLLRNLSNITYKKMMGEYILYKDNKIFGGIYDNRFLLKNVKALEEYHLKEVVPYPNAKPFLLVDSEDPDEVEILVKKVLANI